MRVESKALALIDEGTTDEDIYGPDGGFTATLSTPSLDRDGDRLTAEEWLPFADDGEEKTFSGPYVLDQDHGMSVAETIGSYQPFWDGDKIKMRAFFAPTTKGQEARTLVKSRHVRSVSVAFITDKSKKSGEARREMLNAGLVAVPANRDAIIESFKGAKDAVTFRASDGQAISFDSHDAAREFFADMLKSLVDDRDNELVEVIAKASPNAGGGNQPGGMGGDRALLQAAHDALCHLGAVCFPLIDQNAPDPTGAEDGANEKSVSEVEEKAVDAIALDAAIEAFKSNLTQILNPVTSEVIPAETPADPPAVEAAAATDEVPAPAEAAEEAAADVDPQVMANQMLAELFVASHL